MVLGGAPIAVQTSKEWFMGSGLAQVGVLLALTVVGLPLFFFGLMAALDRFEQSLERVPRRVTAATQPSEAAALATALPAPGSAPAGPAKSVGSKSTSAATI
jgi:hypothetical protein